MAIMSCMKISVKKLLLIVVLALLVGFIVFRSREDGLDVADDSSVAQAPLFEVRVLKPRVARPLFGILPMKFEEKLEPGGELRFNHASPGAKVSNVELHRLGLNADGWDLLIETDSEGKITSGTRLVYTMILAEKQRRLRCRPAEPASGYFRAMQRTGSSKLNGRFQFELATCENDETGKVIEWPPAPLTIRGSFKGLALSQK